MGRQDVYSTSSWHNDRGHSTARQSSQSEKTDICFSVGMGAQPGQGVLREIANRPSLAWIIRTIQCGHDAMLDEPEEVANILREAAEITLTKS
jgi:hypothetical protein